MSKFEIGDVVQVKRQYLSPYPVNGNYLWLPYGAVGEIIMPLPDDIEGETEAIVEFILDDKHSSGSWLVDISDLVHYKDPTP